MAASRPLSTFAHLSTSIFPGCDLLPDLLTGRHRGFAFITFEVSLEPGALLPNSKTGLLKVITALLLIDAKHCLSIAVKF